MSNVAKLKKQAAEYELKKQFDKALAIYVKLLDSFDENADELDVALFNRVGDLMLRQGNVADLFQHAEKVPNGMQADSTLAKFPASKDFGGQIIGDDHALVLRDVLRKVPRSRIRRDS